jgi:hypothetical protein
VLEWPYVCWPIRVPYLYCLVVAIVAHYSIQHGISALVFFSFPSPFSLLPTVVTATMAGRSPPLPSSGEPFPPLPLSYRAALAVPPPSGRAPTAAGALSGLVLMAVDPAPPPLPASASLATDPRRPRLHRTRRRRLRPRWRPTRAGRSSSAYVPGGRVRPRRRSACP